MAATVAGGAERIEARGSAHRGTLGEVLAGLWAAIWVQRGRTVLTLVLRVGAKLAAVCVPLA